MPWGFAAAAVGALGGAAISASAANSAASKESKAAKQASQVQLQAQQSADDTELQMFDQTQANEAPYLAAGNNALAALTAGVGTPGSPGALNAPYSAPYAPNYQESPGYQFQFNQGEKALLNAKSATGGVNSGNTLKALTSYGQGVANQDYQQYLTNYNSQYWNQYNAYVNQQNQQAGQLQSLAGAGQNAAASLGGFAQSTGNNIANIGVNTANSVANNITGAANAGAAATVATGNTIGNSLNSLGSNYLLYNALSNGGLFGGSGSGGVNYGADYGNVASSFGQF